VAPWVRPAGSLIADLAPGLVSPGASFDPTRPGPPLASFIEKDEVVANLGSFRLAVAARGAGPYNASRRGPTRAVDRREIRP